MSLKPWIGIEYNKYKYDVYLIQPSGILHRLFTLSILCALSIRQQELRLTLTLLVSQHAR